ncbi:hypothetical protein PGTUg99_005549 [Puccinia graminis f. sp. tritici]|uniref:Uncharacterized protein n=1 Tax=Puccinia graminis f. sp. tritici TaxID=56615 RepID=A0A5B0S9P2_PUCGR|nr:hypothetical protein PGTUg99_005549 [Puccinia graminis f. sp. tritici]
MPSTPRTPRRTRTRTRTRRPIAYSSQHIIAVATNNRTIQLRFIPNPNRPTPANEYQLSKQEEHPLRIEELLFSPDGTQLLIISISPARLRLSILNQSPDKADQWNLAWDYLIRTKQPTKISAATFINQTRRSFVEPVYENQQTQNPIEIGSNKYHPLRRTTASAINSFAHGKGQTAILVFNTNQSNLPPHTLLTSLDHSVESLKLIPTPSSDISIEHNNLPTEDGLGSSHPTPTNATTTTTETLKEIRIAAIGTPPSRRRQSPNEPESQPSLLIAFQSQTRPGVPRPIKQTEEGARFPLGEDEELGDYITGIGDLDDAFDGPSVQPQSTNLSTDHNPDHPDVTKSNNEQADQPPKPSLESHKQDLNLRLRRFEPVPPSDHFSSLISPFLDHLPHQPSFGFIDLIELLIDFDHSIIPNSQVILRHLSFVTSQSSDATDSKTKEDSFRLLASFSRQETYEEGIATVIEQLQAWDVRFQLSSLSTGFLSLESINDLRNHSIDPSSSAPTDLLRGPVEWVFNRVGHRKLLIDKESSSSSTEPIEHRSSSLIRVCRLIPQWRVREGCFLVFVEKRKRPIGLFKAANPLEGSEGVDDDDEQGEGEGDEGVEYECWVLDGHDLSTLAVKALPRLDQGELEQVSLSYHGIWACTLDQHGKVRASPLGKSR